MFTGVQAYFATQLQFNYDIEQLFPKNDPALQFHREIEEKFAFHQDYLILGTTSQSGIFEGDFLVRLDRLVEVLKQHPLVKEINAPTNLRYHFRTPFGIKNLPFLHPLDSSRYEKDSIFLHSYTDVAPKFISKKNTATCSFIFLNEALTEDNKTEFRSFINQSVDSIGFDHHYIYANIYAQDSYIKELESEMYWLSGLSFLIIIIILFFHFRSFWGVIIPISIVALTILWTLGSMAMFGVAINMMTVLIPTIVSIIALSDVIHVTHRFQENTDLAKNEAIRLTFKDMRVAILLTSLTTGLGFITLSYSSIQPFIEFGVFTTLGVAYAYVLAIGVLPFLLHLIPRNKKGPNKNQYLLFNLYQFIVKKPKSILLFTGFVLLFSMIGMTKLKVNSFLYEELSSKDTFSETLQFFEEHFSGIRTFSLHLAVKDSTQTMLDLEVLEQVDKLENYLLYDYGLNDVYTIGTQIKRANRVTKKGKADGFVLPKDSSLLKYITQYILKERSTLGLQSILTEDLKESKITGKITDLGSAEISLRNEKLNIFIQQNIDTSLIKTQLTGSTLLLDKSNKIITYKLLYGLLFAVVIVSLLMGFLYRSIRIAIIAIVPNLLPLVMILGIIGWTNIGLKMSTIIVFTIAFGIAVDDTIHFMNRLNNELKAQKSISEAIQLTFFTTGRSIITTSIILILGFGVLLFSAFQTTFLTGLLVSLALIFALFADLILLPVLLKTGHKHTN